MLSLPPTVRVFVSREPADMRKSFDGLSGLVIDVIDEDPQSGHLFCFFNRRKDRMKILYWDRGGFWLYYRRLERGTFAMFDRASNSSSFEVEWSELSLILEGIDLRGASRRERFAG